MIYLAAPYSNRSNIVRRRRFDAVNRAAAKLIDQGNQVISPISHSHPIAVAGDLPLSFDYWEKWNLAMLSQCDAMMVLQLDGWQDSAGVHAEMLHAQEMGIPITPTWKGEQ